MKIKLRTTYAHPNRTAQAGSILLAPEHISEDDAIALVLGGYAAEIEEMPETSVLAEVETAEAAPNRRRRKS